MRPREADLTRSVAGLGVLALPMSEVWEHSDRADEPRHGHAPEEEEASGQASELSWARSSGVARGKLAPFAPWGRDPLYGGFPVSVLREITILRSLGNQADMFVVERLSSRVTQVAEAVKNTEVWERSVPCPLLTKKYNQLAAGGLHFASGLIGPRGSLPDYPAAAIARGVRLGTAPAVRPARPGAQRPMRSSQAVLRLAGGLVCALLCVCAALAFVADAAAALARGELATAAHALAECLLMGVGGAAGVSAEIRPHPLISENAPFLSGLGGRAGLYLFLGMFVVGRKPGGLQAWLDSFVGVCLMGVSAAGVAFARRLSGLPPGLTEPALGREMQGPGPRPGPAGPASAPPGGAQPAALAHDRQESPFS
ncbi:unnamed protein product [Prorocentrum cordatum]|uniref:Solute carrier family 40 protein n=1 Tax=Prorocentrum cordatum TaxID=2364126 RepID=A0ABN9SRE2_9DINO|nr:unnamed protein product [Polarella glacialis]